LVNGAFELAVLLLDVAVLVCQTEVVGRGLQSLMQHQQPIALLGLRPPIGIQRMDGSAKVIGAVLARYRIESR